MRVRFRHEQIGQSHQFNFFLSLIKDPFTFVVCEQSVHYNRVGLLGLANLNAL